MDEKSLLTGIRYVEICCRIALFLCCRISFLIIVLPVCFFPYIHYKFFAWQSGISRIPALCGRCPHPVSGIRPDFSGNTANADGIRPGQPLDKVWCPGFFFLQVLGKPFPIRGIVYGFEIRREPFQAAVIDIFEGIAQHMDDTPLDLGIRIDRADRFLKSCKPVHTEEQHILYATVFQVI